ncbi:MAG: FeoC-like transcriptional regulator [Candidatus Thiosymbion ectosymbiont of Robbea hypermnestra]|nr:FeoC-like transcriptional regulator [Candidatus Thiosymbion ectosymbiont of Robbea hypermnestra]
MILSQLTAYLAERKRATPRDISHRLGSDPQALRMMLGMLERKGRVRKLPGPGGIACTGGCDKCDPSAIKVYEWSGDA